MRRRRWHQHLHVFLHHLCRALWWAVHALGQLHNSHLSSPPPAPLSSWKGVNGCSINERCSCRWGQAAAVWRWSKWVGVVVKLSVWKLLQHHRVLEPRCWESLLKLKVKAVRCNYCPRKTTWNTANADTWMGVLGKKHVSNKNKTLKVMDEWRNEGMNEGKKASI